MNSTRLLLSQFRVFEATKALKMDFDQSISVVQFQNQLKSVKLNRIDLARDFTPIFGLQKEKPSMLLGAGLFIGIFILFNILILVYYCYRIRKIRTEDPEYSVRSLHRD